MAQQKQRIVLVTGMSGAGKSQAKKALEDLNFYCVDNLPPSMISGMVDLMKKNPHQIPRLAIVVDIRGGEFFDELMDRVLEIKRQGTEATMFFLEASDDVLLKRYKETRRMHPMNPEGDLLDSIRQERRTLQQLKIDADYIIHTDSLTFSQLKNTLATELSVESQDHISLIIKSFGYKHGIPADSDFVFDLRYLPNPFYVPELRARTGEEKVVRDYVLSFPEALMVLDHTADYLTEVLALVKKESRKQLVISFGCTGGQHRSVTFAIEMASVLMERTQCITSVYHRELHR